MPQNRNAEMVNNLTQDFARRNEFNQSGARLSDVMMWLNRDGGGSMIWAFDAQDQLCYGRGAAAGAVWAETNIDVSNYAATANGGPYVTLNGTDEYLSIADAAWQEPGSYSFLVWGWAYPTVATLSTIFAKWNFLAPANDRSWRLYMPNAGTLAFQVNSTGAPAANVSVGSGVVATLNTWHFVAGYYSPSSLLAIGTATADSPSLTYVTNTASIPALLWDTGSALYIGALSGAAAVDDHWTGRIGPGLARFNVPATNIRSHMTRLFHATRWFYQE